MSWTLSPIAVFCCFAAGILLGGFYFGGLWLTVRQIKGKRHFARTVFFSWLVRTAVLLGGFYVVMRNDWQRLLVAFAGLLAVRFVVVSRIRNMALDKRFLKTESENGKL